MPIKDLSNMSKEKLIEYALSLQKEISSLKQSNTKAKKKIEKVNEKYSSLHKEHVYLQSDFFKLQIKFNKLLTKYENKNYTVKLYNHNIFYSKKENKNENIVINEVEEIFNDNKKKGRPLGSRNFESINWEDFVTQTIINEPESLLCPDCSSELIKFNEDISYKVKKVPSKIEVIKIITPIYKCPKCENKLVQANSYHPFNHSVLTGSLAANIIDAKYNLGVPLYRYSKYLNDRKIPLSTMDLSNYVLSTSNLLKPLYDTLISKLVNNTAKVFYSDETPLEVLDYKKDNRKNGYVFVYVTTYYDNPIYIYDFNRTRETNNIKNILKDYHGYLVCDGYAGYDDIASKNIKIQRCWAHIRRNFYNISKTLSQEQRKSSIAFKMVLLMEEVFHLESIFVEKGLSPEEIYTQRHLDTYQSKLNAVYDLLHSINAESGTPLDNAVKYFLNVENESKTFLEDGHIPLTSNLVERAVKPFAICRRNFLFSKSEKGAESSTILFSLLQTARANGLVPELYLEYVIDNINKVDPLEDLLPWSDKIPSNIKIVL